MGGLDSQSAHHRTLKKHQKELRILPGCHHGAPYAYVLHWLCRIYGKSWQNMEQHSDQGGAKSTTRTFAFRLGGLTFGKKKSEAWFYWASDRVVWLFWVLPDSNNCQTNQSPIAIRNGWCKWSGYKMERQFPYPRRSHGRMSEDVFIRCTMTE